MNSANQSFDSEKHSRIAYLKGLKSIANKYLNENKLAPIHNAKWEAHIKENNLAQLQSIIRQLNRDLKDANVNQYITEKIAFFNKYPKESFQFIANTTFLKIKEEGLLFEIARYSLSYSIINDLYWINDGLVGDHLDIALGKRDPEILEEFCEDKIKEIQQLVLPYLRKRPCYSFGYNLINNIIEQYSNNSFVATNILLPVAIENMVRAFAAIVYKHQNTGKTVQEAKEYVSGFISLETLILKGAWTNDIPIGFYDAALRSRYINDPQLSFAEQTIKNWGDIHNTLNHNLLLISQLLANPSLSDELKREEGLKISKLSLELIAPFREIDTQPILVSLKVELQFLVRRFKDDRNSVLHGDFKNFDRKWKTYINFSAVFKLYKLMLIVDNLYESQSSRYL